MDSEYQWLRHGTVCITDAMYVRVGSLGRCLEFAISPTSLMRSQASWQRLSVEHAISLGEVARRRSSAALIAKPRSCSVATSSLGWIGEGELAQPSVGGGKELGVIADQHETEHELENLS